MLGFPNVTHPGRRTGSTGVDRICERLRCMRLAGGADDRFRRHPSHQTPLSPRARDFFRGWELFVTDGAISRPASFPTGPFGTDILDGVDGRQTAQLPKGISSA